MKKFLLLILISTTIATVGCSPREDIGKLEEEIEVTESETISEVGVILTDEEKDYLNTIKESFTLLADSTTVIQSNFQDARYDSSLLSQDDWKNELRGEFLRISLNYAVLVDMRDKDAIPHRFKELHETVEEAFGLYSDAGITIVDVIDRGAFSSPEINEGIDLMNMANSKIDEVTEMMIEINSKNTNSF